MNIRKFVGIAAGFGAAVALGLSAQTAVAHVGGQPVGAAPTTDLTSLSPACMAALQAIRAPSRPTGRRTRTRRRTRPRRRAKRPKTRPKQRNSSR